MSHQLKDGLYQVNRYGICAGFTVRDGKVDLVAPILRRKIAYWLQHAEWICP